MTRALAVLSPFALVLALTVAACGGGQDHCAQACDRLDECQADANLSFTCGQTDPESCESTATWHDCSHCVLDSSCDSLKAGACASACP